MRAVVQRVRRAAVRSGGTVTGEIGPGLLVLVGVAADDEPDDAEWLAGKIARQKILADIEGGPDLSIVESGGGLLVVSQFTLLASTRKGTRPSWHRAAPPAAARPLYEEFVRLLGGAAGRPVATGEFGAMMEVELINDGPVTLVLDSRLRE
jgi:D-tyrosyl-tRNA(Tyr) deacylase